MSKKMMLNVSQSQKKTKKGTQSTLEKWLKD